MKEIVLGVWNKSFYKMMDINKHWLDWPFYDLDNSEIDIPESFDILQDEFDEPNDSFYQDIYAACIVSNVVNMLLDDIILPLNPKKSVTCAELNIILYYPEILNKTKFWLNGELLDRQKVIDMIQKVKDEQITFNDINFE